MTSASARDVGLRIAGSVLLLVAVIGCGGEARDAQPSPKPSRSAAGDDSNADADANGDGDGDGDENRAPPGDEAGDDGGARAGEDASPGAEDAVLEAKDFGCILRWPQVRRFRITNVRGRLDEALAVARSPNGGTYPVGTILQLVPTEAMVKRARGWNPQTNDWEFFALDVSRTRTTIRSRGAAETVNAFNGNCFDCHKRAEPKWDFVCEDNHGCDPLPIGPDQLLRIQNDDPRCK
jgi:hypothetical protein